MGRPRLYDEPRVTTAIRLPLELRERLRTQAHERDVSVNYLVNRAIEEFLAELEPPSRSADVDPVARRQLQSEVTT